MTRMHHLGSRYIFGFLFALCVCLTCVACKTSELCEGAECEEIKEPCSTTGCLPGQFCNVENETCETREASCQIPESEECTQGACSLCPTDLFCDATTGYCVPSNACQFIECPRHQECDPSLRACAALVCDETTPCPPDSICTENGLCGLGCLDNNDCFPGTQCVREPDQRIGRCVTPCEQDTQCPWREVCSQDEDGGIGQCIPEPPCDTDSACREGEICILTQCRRPLCQDDATCDEGEYCDVSTGDCRPDSCTDDQFEPNSTPQESARILAGTYQNLSLCRADRDDWYEITLPNSEQDTEISIIYTLEQSDLDLKAYLSNGDLIAASGLSAFAESLIIPAQTPSPIRLHVSAVTGADSTYLLQIEPRPSSCVSDSLEPNNTPQMATAQPIGTSTLRGSLCPNDTDIIQLVPQTQRSGVRTTLTLDRLPNDSSTISFAWSLDGREWTPIPSVNTRTFEDLFFFVRDDERLLLRIQQSAAQDTTNPPEPIAWTLSTLPTSPLCADSTHDNQTPENALSLNPVLSTTGEDAQGTLSNAVLCLSDEDEPPLETDWFLIRTDDFEGQDFLISLRIDEPQTPRTRAVLYTGSPPTPWRISTPNTDGVSSALRASISRFDRPLWISIQPNSDAIRVLQSWPRYDLDLTLKRTDTCTQDRSEQEGNNTPTRATIIETTSLQGILCANDIDVLRFSRPTEEETEEDNGREPFLRILSLDGHSIRYALRTSPEAQPLIAGSTLPNAETPTNITSWAALPASVTQVWVEVIRMDAGEQPIPYTVTNE